MGASGVRPFSRQGSAIGGRQIGMWSSYILKQNILERGGLQISNGGGNLFLPFIAEFFLEVKIWLDY